MPLPAQANILLNKYNPTLVMFPQEPDTRRSPDAEDIPKSLLGDYHPCSAEFLLARVEQRDRPRPYFLFAPGTKATGLNKLRAKLAAIQDLPITQKWELDVAGIPSQDGKKAWNGYGKMLKELANPYERVAYGRWYQDSRGIALQYWYLYMYNDFFNNHEGDWEMVALELGGDDAPTRMGFASHHGGLKLPWSEVKTDGDSPLVYIAKGSHAAYPAYSPTGYATLQMDFNKNFPVLLRWAKSLAERVVKREDLVDFPPADPTRDHTASVAHHGVAFKPVLKVMPDEQPAPDSEFWWMRYQGKWGSWHTRMSGWTGVSSPWAPDRESDLRWQDPIAWINSLRPS